MGRLIDADKLKEAFILKDDERYYAIEVRNVIDNAPTVEPFEPDFVGAERLKARQRGYKEGYHNGMEIGKSLNPKIKNGKWEDKSIYEQFGNPPRNFIRSEEFRCSNCQNLPVKTIVNGCLVFCLTEFCPNCGADMRGES